ncbi:TetR family transcriptional regulator [Agromyces intestinalis]|uniref:TetR family transcriptional regulator n=1 Tax=Agromyces intestinalis TaxID=2592652 RepID=A0A5C1YIE3_9MICO|nr:TetR/AcrR family transcriptional regulator C-terminal domain-containing protein [Agromyces intestinalis]QEO14552.1 TetR family transcriptional regulator [Agromyces intestinalis]
MATTAPKGLTRARIVEAALDVLDDDGIDAVTVRAVAKRLGVQAPALYWHVKHKQELLDEMGTEIQRRVIAASQPVADAAWPELLGGYARALRTEYLAHRDGARTFSGTRTTDPAVLRAQEPMLRAAVAQGVDLEHAVTAAELVTAFVVGWVIEEQERGSRPQEYTLAERTAALGDDAPLTAAAGGILARDREQRFEQQLATILAAATGPAAAAAPRPEN